MAADSDLHEVGGGRKEADGARVLTRPWLMLSTVVGMVKVHLVPSSAIAAHDGGEDADGLYIAESGEILINERLSESRRNVVLMHEILHVLFSDPGSADLLPSIFGCRPSAVAAAEERVVVFLASRLYDALLRSGFLIPPTTTPESP